MDSAITALEYQDDGMVIDFIDLHFWVLFVLLECENARHGTKIMRCLLISLGGMRLVLNILIVTRKTRRGVLFY